jgi:hypothetical protein
MTDVPAPGAIAAAVRAAVLGEFRRDSCIASARVAIGVCRYWGIPARPLAVRVAAYTRIAWDQRDVLDGLPAELWPEGAWAVGIAGGRHRQGRWNGHLVALAEVPPGTWLLDPSLDQLARPGRGLAVAAAAFALPQGWDGDPAFEHAWEAPDGGPVIIYGPLDDDGWRDSPNWAKQDQIIRRVTGAAIRALVEK